mmetsp:Transcript_10777/g.28276  ORF Transcript_10777/g.28276 Transcript_10777/m.28276 type:complete len:220 (-) Transcript_10777:321-980(-)
MADPRFDIDYKAGGTPAQQINSLATEAEGPLRVSHQFLLCQLEGGYDAGPGPIDYPMTKFEYCTLDGLHLDAVVDKELEKWHVTPQRCARLLGALSAATMPSACVHGGIDETRIVVLEWMAKLSLADRTIIARSRSPTYTSRPQQRGTSWQGSPPPMSGESTRRTQSIRSCATCSRVTGPRGGDESMKPGSLQGDGQRHDHRAGRRRLGISRTAGSSNH